MDGSSCTLGDNKEDFHEVRVIIGISWGFQRMVWLLGLMILDSSKRRKICQQIGLKDEMNKEELLLILVLNDQAVLADFC